MSERGHASPTCLRSQTQTTTTLPAQEAALDQTQSIYRESDEDSKLASVDYCALLKMSPLFPYLSLPRAARTHRQLGQLTLRSSLSCPLFLMNLCLLPAKIQMQLQPLKVSSLSKESISLLLSYKNGETAPVFNEFVPTHVNICSCLSALFCGIMTKYTFVIKSNYKK